LIDGTQSVPFSAKTKAIETAKQNTKQTCVHHSRKRYAIVAVNNHQQYKEEKDIPNSSNTARQNDLFTA
jgi:hypothetical protein